VAAFVERSDRCVLICRPNPPDPASAGSTEAGPAIAWELPGGEARHGESPEAALRREARRRVGLDLEILVGQPPLLGQYAGREVEFRYFLCATRGGQADALDYAEIRWVQRGQLCEYDFDSPTREVIAWYLE